MKELFGTNVTNNTKNEKQDCEGFETVVQETPNIDKYYESMLTVSKLEKESLRAVLSAIAQVSLFATLIPLKIIVSKVKTLGLIFSLKSALNASPNSVKAIIILLLISVGLFSYESYMKIKLVNDEESIEKHYELKIAQESAMKSIGIPSMTPSCDIFIYDYKTKNGFNEPLYPCINLPVFIFRDGLNLSISDYDTRFDIPMSAITNLYEVKKGITMIGWNKEESISDPKFRPYKLRSANICIKLRSYIRLEFILNGEEFGCIFPSYEREYLESVTGKRCQTTEKRRILQGSSAKQTN